jgi:hypothetical protein
MSTKYSKKEFEKDLQELEQLLSGGADKKKQVKGKVSTKKGKEPTKKGKKVIKKQSGGQEDDFDSDDDDQNIFNQQDVRVDTFGSSQDTEQDGSVSQQGIEQYGRVISTTTGNSQDTEQDGIVSQQDTEQDGSVIYTSQDDNLVPRKLNNNNQDDNLVPINNNNNQLGGKPVYTGSFRHFKIVEVNGKSYENTAVADIKENQTPLSAASKLLRSYCRSEGIKKNDRPKMRPITFSIRETTKGSKKKTFGPYHGHYIKYTPSQMKEAKAAGITFTMKPIVKRFEK